MFTSLMRLFSQLSHIILPARCVLCGAAAKLEQAFCQACQTALPSLPHCCSQCARFLPYSDENQPICRFCLASTPPFSRTIALFPYTSPVIEMIAQLKFHHRLYQAQALGLLFANHLAKEPSLPDLLLPVPLHPSRLKERGFNQAIEIARPIARQHPITLDLHGVQRIKHTAAQSGLDAKSRRQNLANAFSSQRSYAGRSIAVLDDVVTTGQTVHELCGLLKRQGATRIEVWCCARRG